MPASTSRPRAAATGPSISAGWLTWTTTIGVSRVRSQPGDQLVGHPLGDHDRQPRVDPQPLKVGDRGQAVGQAGPAVRRPASADRRR